MMRTAILASLALLALATAAAPAQADHLVGPSYHCYDNDRIAYEVCTYQDDSCIRVTYVVGSVRGYAQTAC